MRVLAVTSEPPWPLDSGGHLRTFHLLRSLAGSVDLRLVCPVQPHQEAAVGPLTDRGFNLRPVAVGGRTGRGEAQRLADAALRGEPYAMYGRHAWREVFAAWTDELARAPVDVVYLDHLDSFVYVSRAKRHDRPTAIDLHNLYSRLAERAADEPTAWWTRAWLRHQARGLRRMEARAARQCDLVFAVSDIEASHFRGLGAPNVETVPNGVDCPTLLDLPAGRTGAPVILFLGSLSWPPNVSAVSFLATSVFPAVRARIPEARLAIVGRDPSAEVSRLQGPGVEVIGPVPDVKPVLARASVLAVPLDAGGGTRLKILEAFAAGLPVVSTPIGADGLHAIPDRHFVEAERPAFAAALAELLTNPARGKRLAADARRLAVERYDWTRIGDQAADAIVRLGSRGQSRAATSRSPAMEDAPLGSS